MVTLLLLGDCLARPENLVDEIEDLYAGMLMIDLQSRHWVFLYHETCNRKKLHDHGICGIVRLYSL